MEIAQLAIAGLNIAAGVFGKIVEVVTLAQEKKIDVDAAQKRLRDILIRVEGLPDKWRQELADKIKA